MLVIALVAALSTSPVCTNPSLESMSWRTFTSPIEEIRGDALIIGGRTVHLAAVQLDPSAAPYLRKYVGKRATVWVNPAHFEDAEITAAVFIGKLDLNRALLRRGLAHYVEPPAYSVSDSYDCDYRKAERDAYASRRGIWSSPK